MSEFEEDFITDEEGGAAAPVEVVHFSWKVTKNLTRRLDQYLVDRVGYLSRAGVQRVIREGLVTANGRIVKASYHPQDGDVINMAAPPEPVNELVPEEMPLDIVYEDEHFLALNKQANLIVHPARGKWTGTLVNGLVWYGLKKGFSLSSGGVRDGNYAPQQPGSATSATTGNWRPGVLHRLDRNTTGIMLIAKSEEAHWRLARQFENRTIQKTYMAICHGIPPQERGMVNAPIGKDKFIREKQAIRKIENGGKEAITLYEVQKSFHHPVVGACSLVKLTPKTGRTHQLRVHMTSIHHPMLGDTIYGGKEIHLPPPPDTATYSFIRQALHAYEISFMHPGTLKPMTITAPLPQDFLDLIAQVSEVAVAPDPVETPEPAAVVERRKPVRKAAARKKVARKKAAPKPAKKAVKKTGKKTVGKAIKKPAQKLATKSKATKPAKAKKAAKKVAKKAAKKVASKGPKRKR